MHCSIANSYLDLLERDQKMEFRKDRPLVPEGIERQRMVLKCFIQTGKLTEASELIRTLIPAQPDEWGNYLGLFDVAKTIGCTAAAYVS
jgi:hypothetical protein